MSSSASLDAEVHSVVFHNSENGYVVARVKAKDEPGFVTVIGNMGELTPGDTLSLKGVWKNHPKFGRQFEVKSFEQARPSTENGVIRYLANSIQGIGRKTAERIVEEFGVEALDVLDTDPERLLAVKGVSERKLADIVESWEKQREVKNLFVFLNTHEVPTTYAGRIFELYGVQAEKRLRENPYALTYAVRGIGFKTADAMALKLGFTADSPHRIEAAIAFVLETASDRSGHLYLLRDKLLDDAAKLLGEVEFEKVELGLDGLEEKKRVHVERFIVEPAAPPDTEETDAAPAVGDAMEDIAVFLMRNYRYENEIAQRLHGLLSHPTPVSRAKVERTLPEIESELGFSLSDEQREAVFGACVNKVFVITGGPGTGKTTITRAVVATLEQLGLQIKLAAPTGRAAKRLSEATGHGAQTLHRMLQYSPETGGFHHNEDQKLKAEVLVVDEVSMLDVQLCVSVLRALPLTCRLIVVGDVNQLPSVGPGNVLADLIDSGVVPTARLSHIFRQAQESDIIMNAHRINAGKFPHESQKLPPEADFFWVHQEDPSRVQQAILDTVCERIPERYGLDPMRDVQVLTPMHKGEVGTMALNTLLQERLNPKRGPEIKRGHTVFRGGDRILQLRNNYDKDVFNGDLGRVVEVDAAAGELAAEFDGNLVHFESADLDDLGLAYAVSVHKSQGSEYPAVVVPVVTQHYMLLQRNLLYTALTRARRLAVMIGSERAFHIGLANVTAGRRNTRLRARLRDVFRHHL